MKDGSSYFRKLELTSWTSLLLSNLLNKQKKNMFFLEYVPDFKKQPLLYTLHDLDLI